MSFEILYMQMDLISPQVLQFKTYKNIETNTRVQENHNNKYYMIRTDKKSGMKIFPYNIVMVVCDLGKIK